MRSQHILFSLLIASFTLVGCAGSGSSAPEDKVVQEGSQTLKGGEWAFKSVTLKKPRALRISYSTSGPAMDAYFVTEDGLNAWKKASESRAGGAKFSYIAQLSAPGVSGELTTDYQLLDKGTYYLILDNTPFGSVTPAGGAEAKASYTVKRMVGRKR